MAGNRQHLNKGLERGALAIVWRYIDELPVCQYVVTDGSLPRQKERNLEGVIGKVSATIRDEEGEGDGLDSDLGEFEGFNEESLMEPKERRPVRDGKSVKRQKQNCSREPPKNVSLKDIGGMEEAINGILEFIAMPLAHPEVYLHTGVRPPRGVLLHGPSSCGKTMLANTIAGEVGLPFIAISAPSRVSGMPGESEKKLRELFEGARVKVPCLIFMDEIDTITPKRDSAQREMEIRIKTGGKPVMIIGATSRPGGLDPALKRAGRFDREICLNVPDEAGRGKVLCERLRLSGDFDFKNFAKTTPGLVGADLSALVIGAVTVAMRRICEILKTSTAATDPLGVTIVDQLRDSANMDMGQVHSPPLSVPAPVPVAPNSSTALPKIQPSPKREVEIQMAIVQPIKRLEFFPSVGVTAPADPAGKAVANKSRAGSISVRGPELLDKARILISISHSYRASNPCVIFFDELDALAPGHNASLSESFSRVMLCY
ncbi:AAA-domain-containing protein [Tuber magnatum]|uniref:AAA-domain-containing protein n=1 Tax=Tuber magnatum TaxID=42249 RepID=A0A317T3G9_9PEZI|nr:AAA-domain-containing protein [Tuber magnatum]